MSESMDDLLDRHRKEKKNLKEKSLAMKKAAKCGNKQKQKETNAEIEKLEKDLEQRHAEELKNADGGDSKPDPAIPSETKESEEPQKSTEDGFYNERQISSKNQKRQAKKLENARKVQEAYKEDRKNANSSLRFIELEALNKVLADLSLDLFDIQPDGDCLYNAIADQLSGTKGFENVKGKDMRRRAAKYLLDHKEEYAPFITNDMGDPLDEFEYEEYCHKVESEAKDGGVWGGEPELKALSESLERKIVVIQPEGRLITFGEELTTKPLTIIYHRHAYQLGEHYNSTRPATISTES